MKAKDTVLPYLKVSNQIPMTLLEFIAKLEEQAEISFKAGVEHGLVIAKKNYLLGKGHGIREVVEWIEPHLQNLGSRDFKPDMWITISKRDWQAQLKIWGIKDDCD